MWRVASKCELRLPLLQGAAGAEGADQRGQVPRDRYIYLYILANVGVRTSDASIGCQSEKAISHPIQFSLQGAWRVLNTVVMCII